jgi:hypothetical protein
MFSNSVYSTTTFFVAVILFCLAIIFSLGSKNHSPRSFAFAIILTASWVSCIGAAYLFWGRNDILTALFVRGGYFFGTVIPFAVFYFALTYPDNYKPPVFIRTIFISAGILTAFFYFAKDVLFFFTGSASILFPEQTIVGEVFKTSNGHLGWYPGKHIIFFFIFFFGSFCAALSALWQKYKQQTDPTHKKETLYMFWAMTTGFIPAGIFNCIFPFYGIFALYWPGIIATLGWVCIIGYSVIKENQMNVMTVTSELLVIILILLMFIGMFAV